MYDDEIDTDANDYLAELAKSPPEWAAATLELELARSRHRRTWFFDMLDILVWGWHGTGCRCPLEEYPDPVVRVRGSSKAIRRYVAEASEHDGVLPRHWITTRDVDDVARALMDTQLLRSCLAETKREHVNELAQRKARRCRYLGDHDAGML